MKLALILVSAVAGVLALALVAVVLTSETVTVGGSPEPGGAEADAYCSPEKEDQLAALELGSGDTINSPRLLRRSTGRFLRENSDAPSGAGCVDQELEFLLDVWNGNRGDDRYPEAAEQVRELRKFERR